MAEGEEEGVWKKKFSSYPLGENAVPKLVARFVTESSRETRSSPGNCRPGTGLSQLLAFDQLSLPPFYVRSLSLFFPRFTPSFQPVILDRFLSSVFFLFFFYFGSSKRNRIILDNSDEYGDS